MCNRGAEGLLKGKEMTSHSTVQKHRPGFQTACLLIAVLAAAYLTDSAWAQTSTKKRIRTREIEPKKAKAKKKKQVRKLHPKKASVRPQKTYSHVRVLHPHRLPDGRLHSRPLLARSAAVASAVLNQFERRRQDQINRVILDMRNGRREQAIRIWANFVVDLADHPEPVDLDEIMLLIARDSCGDAGNEFRLRAARLEYMQESLDRTAEYLDFLEHQRDRCKRHAGLCPFEMLKNLETQIIRTRADRDVFVVEERLADHRFNELLESSRDYERRFTSTFDDLYREVELRIRISP